MEKIPVCFEPLCCDNPDQILLVDNGEVACVKCRSCSEKIDAPEEMWRTMSDLWRETMEERNEGEEKEESLNLNDIDLYSIRFPMEIVIAVERGETPPCPEQCREEFINELDNIINGYLDVDVEKEMVEEEEDLDDLKWVDGIVRYKGGKKKRDSYFEVEEPTVEEILEARKDREEDE